METGVCVRSSIAVDVDEDIASFETADAAMRSANLDVRSKLFSFNMPCNDVSSCKQQQSPVKYHFLTYAAF